jgi:hypothetical protein
MGVKWRSLLRACYRDVREDTDSGVDKETLSMPNPIGPAPAHVAPVQVHAQPMTAAKATAPVNHAVQTPTPKLPPKSAGASAPRSLHV